MPTRKKRSQRWTEAEELRLIQLYEKYKGPDDRFCADLVKDHELIGGRTRQAHAAKLLQEYRIFSHGSISARRSAQPKYQIALALQDGMAVDDAVEQFGTTREIVEFVLNNTDRILSAAAIKKGKKVEYVESKHNFQKPKWTVLEDMELMRRIGPYIKANGHVDWKNAGSINLDTRDDNASRKRYQNHLKKELEVHGDGIYFRGERINKQQEPKPVVAPTPKPEPQPKPEPRMITKSYLWGMFTVTKPV